VYVLLDRYISARLLTTAVVHTLPVIPIWDNQELHTNVFHTSSYTVHCMITTNDRIVYAEGLRMPHTSRASSGLKRVPTLGPDQACAVHPHLMLVACRWDELRGLRGILLRVVGGLDFPDCRLR